MFKSSEEQKFEEIVREFRDVIPGFDDKDYVNHLKTGVGGFSIDYYIIDVVIMQQYYVVISGRKKYYRDLLYNNDTIPVEERTQEERFETLKKFLRENVDIIKNGQLKEFMEL